MTDRKPVNPTRVDNSDGACNGSDVELREQLRLLKIENDVLRGVVDVLKVGGLKTLTNAEKTRVINHLRRTTDHRLNELTNFLKISGSYNYQRNAQGGAVIRLAGLGDEGVVAKLLRDFNTEFDTPVPDNLEQRFARLLVRDDVIVLLAGEIGFAYLTLRPSPYYDGPVAMLEELYVASGQRNEGIGTALMRAAMREVLARDAGEVQINVDEVDTDAQRFYERHGFTNIEQGSRMLLYIRELHRAEG